MNQNQKNNREREMRRRRDIRLLSRLTAFVMLVTSLFYGVQLWQERHSRPATLMAFPKTINK